MNHKRQVKEKLGHVARGTNSRLPFDLVQTRTQSLLIYSRKGIRKRQFETRKSAWEGVRKSDAPRTH